MNNKCKFCGARLENYGKVIFENALIKIIECQRCKETKTIMKNGR
jgi:hypothetical protein